MHDQVLSIPQCEELVALGIDTSNASMCWAKCAKINSNKEWESYWHLELNEESHGTKVPTFTLQDILEMLPKPCYINCIDDAFYQCEITTENGSTTTNGSSPLKAAFEMLKSCKQNNKI